MKIYLVTGVAGFIGSNLAEELIKDPDCLVIGVDNFYSGYKTNLEILKSDNFIFYECDICDYKKLKSIFDQHNIEFILHKAAISSVQKSLDDPVFSNRVNVRGTLKLLSLARDYNVKRFVFASSAAVYGDEPVLPKNEKSNTNPISPYGYEKLMCENYLDLFSNLHNLETIKLRYFNVYGPRQDPNSDYSGVISIFENNFSNSKSPVIYGNGEQFRDFIHVKDIVKVNIAASHCDYDKKSRLICCGSGTKTSINELFDFFCKKYNANYLKNYFNAREGDIFGSVSENQSMLNLINHSELIKFKEGISNL
jgi:nucleoside-diphosphate-sugar epimerase